MSAVTQASLQKRLLLGISPLDGVRQQAVRFPVRIEIEQPAPHVSSLHSRQFSHAQYPLKNLVEGLTRHPGGRYSLHYFPTASAQSRLRIYDLQRRYVPRKIQFPLLTLEQIQTIEQSDGGDYLQSRVRFPVLFPGAAYPLQSRETGLRGRVMQNGEAVRWAYIELRDPEDSTQILARARGDDRGEFLLLLPPSAIPDVTLNETVTFSLRVWARATPLSLPSPDVLSQDPYWDLPVEEIIGTEADDDVSSGLVVANEYVASQVDQSVMFTLTQIQTSLDVGDIAFNPP